MSTDSNSDALWHLTNALSEDILNADADELFAEVAEDHQSRRTLTAEFDRISRRALARAALLKRRPLSELEITEHHPLVGRAVEGLDRSTGEARRALYAPARIAPAMQLRAVERLNGFSGAASAYQYDERPSFLLRTNFRAMQARPTEGAYKTDDAYATEDYYDEAPRARRRSGFIAAMAIFGLAVIGTAGAFGYRAMFGGSVLPMLPPIIEASNGPMRFAPASGDSQAKDAKQAGAATTGSTENLFSREEQPVAIEPPKAAPHVVATIPIVTGQGSGQAPGQAGAWGLALTSLSVPAATSSPGSDHVASAVASPWPPPPPTSTLAPAPPAAAAPAPPQPLARGSSEPKKVHTVTIRADQSGGADASPGSTTAAAPAPTPPRTRASIAPVAIANANTSAAAPAPSAGGGGGYAVQVTLQRSEGEAHSAFRALQAKYPNQLGGRTPIIRRADLGDKGTFYRALVGPFGSAEEAAGLCSGLKAAGGKCIVQRN